MNKAMEKNDPIRFSTQWKGRTLTGTSETSNGEAKKEMIEGISTQWKR